MGIIDSGQDITNLCSGAVRVVLAPITEDVPESIADILGMESPYTLAGDWTDLGATTGPTNYGTSHESQGLSIEQRQGNVQEDVTSVGRSISLPLAELTPENVQIIENAAEVGTIAAAAGASAQQQVKVGSFTQLTEYRVALIGQRHLKAGAVQESGSGPARGRMVVQCLYRVSLTADERSFEFAKGSLHAATVGFTAYPEPGLPAEEADGTWFFEDAGTITDA